MASTSVRATSTLAGPTALAGGRRRERPTSEGPAGQHTIRRQNLGLVMREVMDNGPRSRASIAEAVGLTKSTVSSLVAELLDRGLLSERGFVPGGGVGRPGRLVGLSDRTVGLGLEINVDYLAVCVLDLTGAVRYEEFVRHENRGVAADLVLDAIGELGRRALATVEVEGLIPVGAAIAMPGLVDVDSGVLLTAPNLGWRDVRVRPEIIRRLGRPHLYLTVENEANLAALGEVWQGSGRDWGSLVHVSGEVGVGGALVINGELMHFGNGFGGELGHISIQPDGPPCSCGSRGCLERIVGQEALLAAARLDAGVGTSIGLPDGGVRRLVERAGQADPTTLAALSAAGRVLGQACATVTNLFAPDAIILGGIYAPLFPWLIEPLRLELEHRSFVARYATIAVIRSELGPAAAVRGAASLSLRAVCSDPNLVGLAAGAA